MRGAIPPLPQDAFMAWCSVKKAQGRLYFYFYFKDKRPFRRPEYACEANIKMDLREIRCGHVEWIQLAEDRIQWWDYINSVTKLRVA
jgi:hypothetical protein